MGNINNASPQKRKPYQPPVIDKYKSLQEITACTCVWSTIKGSATTCGCPDIRPRTGPVDICACDFK